jgi:hypothetical protein
VGQLEGHTTVAALRYQDVNLFFDLALHGMGLGRADGISQYDPSETNQVIDNCNDRNEEGQQNLLNFLRSLERLLF